MAISDKITQLNNDLLAAYDKIDEKGGTVPADKNSNNLAAAIATIEGGGGEIIWPEPIENAPLNISFMSVPYLKRKTTIKWKIFGYGASSPQLQYSFDNITWHEWEYASALETEGKEIEVPAGSLLYIKGNESATYFTSSQFQFNSTVQDYVKIGGDITSLTNYKTASSFSYSNSIFKNLNVVSAENLVIPDGTICSNLFSDQTNLIIPPKNIPAINITNSMFTSMFKGCTKLEKPSIIGNNEPLIITSPSSLEYPMSNMFNNTNIKVYEDDPTGTLFMNLIGGSISESGDVSGMFSGTKGDFTGNPTVGHKYYYKTDEPEPSEDWWDHTDELTEDDIGTTREVEVNGVTHTIRLIGIDHDDLADGSGKAHTTWEFVNLLSDNTGHSIATVWDWQNGSSSTNYDFINSNIQKALNGTGTAPFAGWYQKGSTTKSTTYTSSVLEMLPIGLQNVIKQVNKVVATTNSYTNTTYATKIFIPSYREMTVAGTSIYQTNEGTTYEYYVAHDDNTSRQKAQINNGDYYTEAPIISDDYDARNYAGFCYDYDAGNGRYRLRSPETSAFVNSSWCVEANGVLVAYNEYNLVFPIAPCFCI